MAKAQAAVTDVSIRDSKTGRMITVRGVGALKGRLALKKSIDLTKPIASQAMKGGNLRKSAGNAKH